MEFTNSKTTELGKGSFACDCFTSAVQMRKQDLDPWLDILPWFEVVGNKAYARNTPYHCEVDLVTGERFFAPDKDDKSKHIRLYPMALTSSLTKSIVSSPSKLDMVPRPNKIVMPTPWGEVRYTLTNTGLKFDMLMNKAPPFDRIQVPIDSAKLNVNNLMKATRGLGIPKPRLASLVAKGLLEEALEEKLEWSPPSHGQTELGFDLTGLKFPVLLSNTTIDEQVGAGLDDASDEGTGTSMYNNSAYIYLSAGGGLERNGGFRFQTVNVPNGAVIDVAYLQAYVYSTSFDRNDSNVYFQDVDDAPNFDGGQQFPVDRTRTTAVTNWTYADPGISWQQSPTLVDGLTEITARGGWAANQAIVALSIDNSALGESATVKSYDGDSSLAAKLHIEYHLAVAGIGAFSQKLNPLGRNEYGARIG